MTGARQAGLSGRAGAGALGACAAAFVAASVLAAVGYPSWMWAFVFAGLVFAPMVAFAIVVVLVAGRLSRA